MLALRHFTRFLVTCIATIVLAFIGTAHVPQDITPPALLAVTLKSAVIVALTTITLIIG